jgi:hypothetical protein
LAQLRELDSFLEAQIDRYYRSGRKPDSHFVKAMEEIQSLLGLGLRLMGWRKKCLRDRAPEVSSRRTEESEPLDLTFASGRKSSKGDENAYLLKYDHELSCLQRVGQSQTDFAPKGFRRQRAILPNRQPRVEKEGRRSAP